MPARNHRTMSGFTMVELMVVVLVLSLLTAMAIPAFSRYLKRSKTSEALQDLSVIYRSQITYFENQHERTTSSSFVNAAPMPAAPPSESKYPENVAMWMSSPEWAALGFTIDRAHYFQYASPGDTSGFVARARGNLDGDTTFSTFERAASLNQGEIQGGAPSLIDELE